MSHKATNWAMAQTGLRPAEKLLLLCLADRHNPDHGCFPYQETLARDACMSRTAVNDNLARLEAAGLIRRERQLDARTKRQMATRYVLGFETETAQDPSPETGHGVAGPEAERGGEPSPEPGHGGTGTETEQAAEPSPETGHGPCLKSAHGPCPDSTPSRVRNPVTNNPVKEPLKKNPPYPPIVGASSTLAHVPPSAEAAPRGSRRRRGSGNTMADVVARLRQDWGTADEYTRRH